MPKKEESYKEKQARKEKGAPQRKESRDKVAAEVSQRGILAELNKNKKK